MSSLRKHPGAPCPRLIFMVVFIFWFVYCPPSLEAQLHGSGDHVSRSTLCPQHLEHQSCVKLMSSHPGEQTHKRPFMRNILGSSPKPQLLKRRIGPNLTLFKSVQIPEHITKSFVIHSQLGQCLIWLLITIFVLRRVSLYHC